MRELFELLIRHARGVWRYRWYMMLVAWLVCVVGWVVVYRLPDQYSATARVHVDTDSVLRPLLRGVAVDLNPSRRIALMTRTLLSRPNLEKLARMTDLDLTAKTPEQMDGLINGLHNNITLTSERGDLYTISYENAHRQMAKRVVQSLLTIFVENSLGDTRADTNSAQQFLGQQLKDYADKLDRAEERLAEFKRKHIGMMPAQGQSYYQSLQSANSDLQQAQLALKEAENQRDALKEQFKNSAKDFKNYSQSVPQPVSPLDQRIQNIQDKIDNLRLKYTDRYPDVIELKRLKAELEGQKRKEAKHDEGAEQSQDPMYQQMKMAIAQADGQVASVKARVDEYQARVNRLKKMVDVIPQVEADLQRLNRDYDVNKKNYELLLARRESASISQQANMNADNVQFQVVDPPHVPLSPSSPNRPLFISVVLLGGILAGGVFGFVLYQLRPTFDDVGSLKGITGVPVLGSISMVRTREYLRRRRLSLASFGMAFVALIAVYGGILFVQLLDLDVISNFSRLKGSLL
ncbi:MAG: XrtA system polysaccharide chain length determinant [Gammaproteobacteria bacterium]